MNNPRLGLRLATLALGVAVVTSWQVPARADSVLAFDADYVAPIDEDYLDSGYGFAIRGGPRLDLKLLTLSGELMAAMRSFEGSADLTVYEGKVGARVGVGTLLRPSAYGHVGFGHARFSGDFDDETKLAADLGLAIDLTILPVIDIGVHSAYNTLRTDPGLDWFTAGGHIAFVF